MSDLTLGEVRVMESIFWVKWSWLQVEDHPHPFSTAIIPTVKEGKAGPFKSREMAERFASGLGSNVVLNVLVTEE